MLYYDYHLHSNTSFDSKVETEDMVKRALELGMKEIIFTEHFEYRKEKYLLPLPDLNKYKEKIEGLKDKYSEKIDIMCGIELGMQSDIKDEIEDKIKDYKFDFIIGSVHTVLRQDFAFPGYFDKFTKKKAYEIYFKELLNSVKVYENFDVVGHLDYIKRYYPFENKDMEYKDYGDIVDEIYKDLMKKGKGIEINSSGIKYGMNCVHPNYDFLKRYYELGGEIITLGSDAHDLKHVGLHFKEIISTLEEIGFKFLAKYKKRKMEFMKISDFLKK